MWPRALGPGLNEGLNGPPSVQTLADMWAGALRPDRGPGMYQGSTGTIVDAYREALARHGFRPFAGENALWQPPDIPDVLLHETVASWVRTYFKQHPLQAVEGSAQNRAAFAGALAACEKHINAHYNVDELCRGFPRLLQELVDKKGERLPH